MGEGPKKRRKIKAPVAAAAGEGEGEAAAADPGENAENAGSVAEVLAKATSASADKDVGGGLGQEYSRLFGGGGGGLFGASTQARRPGRTPSASSSPATARAAGEPATSSTSGADTKDKPASKATDAGGAKPATDRRDGKRGAKPMKLGPQTEEEKKERQQRTVFVGNVPLAWDEKRLRRALRDAVGDKYTGSIKPVWYRSEPIKVKWWKKWKDGHKLKDYAEGVSDAKNGYALVDSPEAVRIVSRAIHGFKADDSHILRGDGIGENSMLQNFDRKRSVFVGNLPAATTEADLRTALGPAGAIHAVRVVRDREAKACKGIAFVRFADRQSAKVALELQPEVQGRWIRIMKVKEQEGDEQEDRSNKDWELTPAARRILMREQRKQRSKINKAAAKRKEAAEAMGKRKGTRTKAKKDSGRPRGKGKKKVKR